MRKRKDGSYHSIQQQRKTLTLDERNTVPWLVVGREATAMGVDSFLLLSCIFDIAREGFA